MYSRTNIKGMPTAVLRRSSSKGQGTSIGNQARTVDSVIAENQLQVIKEYVLEGVSGSIPGNRSDIEDLLILKENRDDEAPLLLLVPDHTRFTRAGGGHGGHLLYELRVAGILVYFVAEDLLVDSDLMHQIATMLLSAAHQTARSIARSSTIGADRSFLENRSPYTRQPPLGLDRMYFLDGRPLHIIRNMPDGTQQMLDPHTRELIRTFDKNPKSGVPAHYIKQKNETVALCRGDPMDIAKVALIFQMRYVQQLKYRRIALKLNTEGIASALGKQWSSFTVRNILLNPIYVAQAIRYRKTKSIYVKGGSPNGEPEPSEVTAKELDERRHVRVRRRQRKNWKENHAEAFEDFLPEEVRKVAEIATNAYLDSIADGKVTQHPNRDRHSNSLFILKDILRCKHTGHPLTGRISGKKGHEVRRYRISRGAHIPKINGTTNKAVRADAIEESVMNLIRKVILDRPNLVQAMKSVLNKAQRQQRQDDNSVPTMEKQIKRLRKQIVQISDQLSGDDDSDDPIVLKIEQTKAEIARLSTAIRLTGAEPRSASADPQSNIERLADQLEKFGRTIDPTDVPLIRRVIELLVSRLEVDLETKQFEIELAIPSWMGQVLQRPLPGGKAAGLDELIACKRFIEAHPENREILGVFHCDAEGKPLCYACRRLPIAA